LGGGLAVRQKDLDAMIDDLATGALEKMQRSTGPAAPNARGTSRPTDPRPHLMVAS